MGVVRTLRYVLGHPLNDAGKLAALGRYVRWQVGSRLALGPTLVPFVNGAWLAVSPGITGATQNIYTGLHEMAECSFLLHLLRPGDLFVDVGSNVGVYTVLASASIGADSVAIEPIPSTYANLRKNVVVNEMGERVKTCNIGLGRTGGVLRLTSDRDTGNHVVSEGEVGGHIVEVPVPRWMRRSVRPFQCSSRWMWRAGSPKCWLGQAAFCGDRDCAPSSWRWMASRKA